MGSRSRQTSPIIERTLINIAPFYSVCQLRVLVHDRVPLLDVDIDTPSPAGFAAKRAHRAHFLLRTLSTPLGPGLNPASSYGITDQQMPLVGYDIISDSGTTGYWPTFTTTSANLYIDMTTTRWLNVYDSSGDAAPTTLSCDIGEVIVGVRYQSHVNAGKGSSSSLSPIPDIECAKLQNVAQVKAEDINSVDTRTITVDNSTGNGVINTKTSVVNVKQCMSSKTNPFLVQQKDSVFNTCHNHMGSGSSWSGSTSTTTTALIEFLLSVESVGRSSEPGGQRGPEVIDFLIRKDSNITSDSLFGTGDTKNDQALQASISASQQTAVNKASAEYKANWGSVPSVSEITQQLGATPWTSDQLLAGSSEFTAGSLTQGGVMQIVRGFQVSSSDPTQVMMICGSVIGCAHGTCQETTCKCDSGWSGPACMERLDPCGSSPCGSHGQCNPNFNNSFTSLQYNCTCDEGFSGVNCTLSSDPCQIMNPVDRTWSELDCGRGQCVANISAAPGETPYMCECLAGYTTNSSTGTCTVKKVDCVGQWSSTLCDDSCNQIDTFHVSIPAQGAGAFCPAKEGDQRSSQCTGGNCKQCMSRDCNNRGSCDSGTGICVCQTGWKGDNCELSTDTCSTNLCSGHGNCDASQTSCTCMNGWKSDPSTAPSVFCSIDPCSGCPPGQCNTFTGTCACPEDQASDPRYPACNGLGAVDCAGQWGPWTQCTVSCQKKRYFTVTTVASGGGKSCSHQAGDVDSAPCTAGSCCTITASQCLNNAQFLPELCTCQCPVGFQGQFCGDSSATADSVVTQNLAVDAATLALFNTTTRAPLDYNNVNAGDILNAQSTPAPSSSGSAQLFIYIGAGVGGLLLIGGLAYMFMGKKPAAPPTDPLLAGMEGLEGMDLTGMDLSALGMDPNAPASTENPL